MRVHRREPLPDVHELVIDGKPTFSSNGAGPSQQTVLLAAIAARIGVRFEHVLERLEA